MGRFWMISAIFAGGCLASNALQYEAMSETNQYRLMRIREGMSEREVLQIMRAPYNYETFDVEGDIYDIWFYVTRTTVLDQTRMVPQNLTPLAFRNGILVGRGYQWYYYALNAQGCMPMQEESEEPHADQNTNLEHSLESIEKTEPKKEPQKLPPNVHIIGKQWEREHAAIASATVKALSDVRLGMNQSQVKNKLGRADHQETFRGKDNVYDVWFYQVGNTNVPLTFQNGILVGKTEQMYNKIKAKCTDCYDREGERLEQDASDQNFNYW
ncbi:MAG: DUF3192 domain-containing protein [Verrucomicrobia bacterium]|nr:DUF3192 domain-containing protein [Verrucomicrobiota bacterium]MDE3047077.1 DUF3192 domain-containing protein [Verrucomicrobiota bacterium]